MDIIIRLAVLLGAMLLACLVVVGGRGFVASRRTQALSATPFARTADDNQSVGILVFSSADCRQCHQLQDPALDRVLAARGEAVAITRIDAPSSPDLTETYRVLTLPTTVVLNARGEVGAINYGFANTQKLLAQIDQASSLSSHS